MIEHAGSETEAGAIGTSEVATYLAQLASGEPVPGGGAAVALTAAQAAALLSMTLRVTGEKASGLPADHYRQLEARLAEIRSTLLMLADQDAKAFAAVMAAYKLPKLTDAQKLGRQKQVQAALQSATEVPLAMMAQTAELFGIAGDVIPVAKKAVVSDAGIAVELATAALKAARFNVLINVQSLTDAIYINEVETRAQALRAELKADRKILLAAVKARLAGK